MSPILKILLVCGYLFFLSIYVFAPVFLFLKKLADAAGGTKKLWKTYALLFLAGGLSTLPVALVEWGLSALLNPDPETFWGCFLDGFVVASFTEETTKFAILAFAVLRSARFVRYTRALSFAACVSLGFAFVENALYVVSPWSPNDSLFVAFMRSFTSIPGHFIFSIFMGYFLALAIFGKKKGVNILKAEGGISGASEKRRKNFYKNVALSYGVAIAAHGVYDFLLMIGASPSQFSGLAFVAWIGLLIAGFYASNLCVDVLKAKDQAVAETKQAARKSDYHINVRR